MTQMEIALCVLFDHNKGHSYQTLEGFFLFMCWLKGVLAAIRSKAVRF